MHQTHQ